jgi:hypothetical protein
MPNAPSADKPKIIRASAYLPEPVHETLRAEGFHRRMTLQAILKESLDLYFAKRGLPSWDEQERGAEDL